MRKKIISKADLGAVLSSPNELDIANMATVYVTSEDPAFPIEQAFDRPRGPGGSRWMAAEPGEQTIILEFERPQTIQRICLEIEELEVSRTQALLMDVSHDGGHTYQQTLRNQEYNFSPPGTTFEREEWTVNLSNVTHLRLLIKPDKGNVPCRATLTSFILT